MRPKFDDGRCRLGLAIKKPGQFEHTLGGHSGWGITGGWTGAGRKRMSGQETLSRGVHARNLVPTTPSASVSVPETKAAPNQRQHHYISDNTGYITTRLSGGLACVLADN